MSLFYFKNYKLITTKKATLDPTRASRIPKEHMNNNFRGVIKDII